MSNRRHVFVGANVLDENASSHTTGDVNRELQAIFGREHILIQDHCGGVPWCHVDMYLTPVDDETILVASPVMVGSLLSVSALGQRTACDAGEERESHEDADELQARLDSVAGLLRRRGYKVYRLPMIADPLQEWMISYNNVLLEQRDGRRVVYMPVYRLGKIDRAAAEVYAGLGFEVHLVDVSGVYRLGGALRCVANVTARRADISELPVRACKRSRGDAHANKL